MEREKAPRPSLRLPVPGPEEGGKAGPSPASGKNGEGRRSMTPHGVDIGVLKTRLCGAQLDDPPG